MTNKLSLRFFTLAIFWAGLGNLFLEGRLEQPFIWLGVVFSIMLIVGVLAEIFFSYDGDPYILPVVQTIMALGLVFLIRVNPELAKDQFVWANIGLVSYYVLVFGVRDYRKLAEYQYLWGLSALILLLVTFFFGVTLNGATSWLKVGQFSFQTEELVKITLLLFMASYLDQNQELLRIGTFQAGKFSIPDKKTLGPFLFIALFVLGLLAAQKSLGTALVFFLLMVLILYLVTERLFYLLFSLPLITMTGIVGYLLFGHVRVRVSTWLNPWVDATGGGFQISQSIFAISGGRIFGTGLGNGIGAYQIPHAETDFIFSVIAEEIGFVGAMALISFFIIAVMRAFTISVKAMDRFGQILAAGIGILIGVEALIILAGVTKMLPLTGLPLPWVSYGGSSLLIHFLLLGILTNISDLSTRATNDYAMGRRLGV